MGSHSEIRHRGIITCIDPLKAEIISESACAGCHAKGFCSMSEKKRKEITRLKKPSGWDPYVGQEVYIVMRTRMGFRAVWLAMVVPCLLLGLVTGLFVWLGAPEWLTGILVITGITIYYFVLYLFKDSIHNDFYFTLHNIDP